MSHDNLPVKDPELGHVVANPGVEEHIERYTDVDAKIAELIDAIRTVLRSIE